MVVKGLDFDNVTLVGILLADTSLNFPDINAAARTFQLTEQAAGRAGRREIEGKVILQTYQPENPTLVYCSLHDYEGFYRYDIAHRQKMWYPPFTEILGIFAANEDLERCIADIRSVYGKVSQCAASYGGSDVKLYEPSPAFLQKLKNKYIYHMLIRYRTGSAFKPMFRNEFNAIKLSVCVECICGSQFRSHCCKKEGKVKMAIRNIRIEGDEI
jgi:primosomal protein N' (replication factor Y)